MSKTMNTLKQLQEKMSEEFDKKFIYNDDENDSTAFTFVNQSNIIQDSTDIIDFLHQQTTLVYEATLAMVLKEIEKIENQKVIFRTFGGCKCNFNQGDIIPVDENNIHTTCGGELPMQVPIQSPLDTLKTKLQAKE